jgi:hypothetical protein
MKLHTIETSPKNWKLNFHIFVPFSFLLISEKVKNLSRGKQVCVIGNSVHVLTPLNEFSPCSTHVKVQPPPECMRRTDYETSLKAQLRYFKGKSV